MGVQLLTLEVNLTAMASTIVMWPILQTGEQALSQSISDTYPFPCAANPVLYARENDACPWRFFSRFRDLRRVHLFLKHVGCALQFLRFPKTLVCGDADDAGIINERTHPSPI